VRVSGAKNAALPIMAAAILCEGEVTLQDVPQVSDVLSLTGTAAEAWRTGRIPPRRQPAADRARRDELQGGIRHRPQDAASICVLGPLLAKRHRAQVAMPGGCAIGDRPVDLHQRAMKLLGRRSSCLTATSRPRPSG